MAKVCKNKKGQFLVASALLIAILFISVASMLSSTTITNLKLLKDDFRKDAMQIISNFRGALNLAIAEVSWELELRSSLYDYENYSILEEYPEAENYGLRMMTSWQNITLLRYTGRSINLSMIGPGFECNWNSSEFYSKASAVMSLDILTYGFYGLKQNVTSELRLQILEGQGILDKVAFTIRLLKEKGLPVTDLKPSLVKILYLKAGSTPVFNETDPSTIEVVYLGSGVYNVTFSAVDYATPIKIKMILRDGRGIVVAAIPESGVAIINNSDTYGPITTNVLANPNPCPKQSITKLTTTVDDTLTGANVIFGAEYFIDTIGENGTGTQMSVSDGYYDSPIENFEAQFSVSSLAIGNHTIYVHGMDAVGNWGNYSNITLNVFEDLPRMHVASIDLKIKRWWIWIRCEATVTIVDAEGKHVKGAMVYGRWSGSVTGTDYKETGTNGKATFESNWIWQRGRYSFTFTVENIVKDGWIYDEDANEETSDTISGR